MSKNTTYHHDAALGSFAGSINKKLEVKEMLEKAGKIADEIEINCEKIKKFFYQFEEISLVDALEQLGYFVLSPKVVKEVGIDWHGARDHLMDLRNLREAQIALKEVEEKEDLLDELKKLRKENAEMKKVLKTIKNFK